MGGSLSLVRPWNLSIRSNNNIQRPRYSRGVRHDNEPATQLSRVGYEHTYGPLQLTMEGNYTPTNNSDSNYVGNPGSPPSTPSSYLETLFQNLQWPPPLVSLIGTLLIFLSNTLTRFLPWKSVPSS